MNAILLNFNFNLKNRINIFFTPIRIGGLVVAMIVLQLTLNAQTVSVPEKSKKQNFQLIDLHAKQAPANLSENMDALAEYLLQGTSSDVERARSAYSWIAYHVRYDYASMSLGPACDELAITTMKNGKAVCEGYAALFQTLGRKMNLDVKIIPGYSKGFGYKSGQKFSGFDHSWNAVLINGKWELMDVTWAAGYIESVNGKPVFKYKFEPFWFMTEPKAFVFTHFPVKPEFLFFSPEITLNQFSVLSKPDVGYFIHGFSGPEALKAALATSRFSFPESFDEGFQITRLQSPMDGNLKAGNEYLFEFRSALEGKFWYMNKGNPVEFARSEAGFSADIRPVKGDLQILFQRSGEDFLSTCMIYQVVP